MPIPIRDLTFSARPAVAPLCATPGCTRPQRATGLCNVHYLRQRRGRPMDAPVNGHKLSLADANVVAAARGGVCLSSEYRGNHLDLHWRCASGHEWLAPLRTVRRGHRCKACTRSRGRPARVPGGAA